MKAKKLLLIGGGVVFGVIVVALVVVYLMLNGIVKSAVESNATASLKLKTLLGGANVSPFSGDVALSDLRIESPEGFSAPEMFTLGDIRVETSYSDLFGAPVKVASISIDKPKLVIEQAGGKLNIKQLYDNLQSDKPAPEPAKTDEAPMKLVISDLTVKGAVVEIRPGIPGLDKPISVTVPDIAMSNIGNAEGNQTGEEIGRVVKDVVRELAAKAADSEQLPPEVRQILKLDVAQLRADVEKRVREEAEKAREKVEDEIKKGVEKGLGDLLKKDEKKK